MVKAANPGPPPPPVQMCEHEDCSFKAKPHYGDFDGKHYCLICKPKAEKAAAPAAEEAAPAQRCEVLKKNEDVCGLKGNTVYRGVMCCTMHLRNEGNKFEHGVTAAIKEMTKLSLTMEELAQVCTLSSHPLSSHLMYSRLACREFRNERLNRVRRLGRLQRTRSWSWRRMRRRMTNCSDACVRCLCPMSCPMLAPMLAICVLRCSVQCVLRCGVF